MTEMRALDCLTIVAIGARPWCVASILAVVMNAGAIAQPASNALPFEFGQYAGVLTEVTAPVGVAIAADGTFVVAEGAGAARVSAFSPSGEFLHAFGKFGDGDAQFIAPAGLAIAGNEIYVSDAGQHRVQVFDLSGTHKRSWGKRGVNEGEFNQPAGLAVDGERGRVYVADVGNRRVQVFDLQGACQGTLQVDESKPLVRPADITIGAEGVVFVADADANRILKFGADGKFIKSWGDWGPFPGFLDEPTGLRVHHGIVYVVDRRNHRVQMFDGEGTHKGVWGVHETTPHEGSGRVHYPNALAIAPDGTYAVLCESIEHRCQLFSVLDRGAAASPVELPPYDKSKQTHFGEHVSIEGDLMVIAEPENHFIYVLNINESKLGEVPIIVNQFGERGEKFGLLMRSAGLDLDFASRSVLVSDTTTRRVQQFHLAFDPEQPPRFDPEMTSFAKSWSLDSIRHALAKNPRLQFPWPIEPSAVCRHSNGELFIIDSRNAAVLVFDPHMQFVRSWSGGGHGAEHAAFRLPTDLCFSRDGQLVYVVDAHHRCVQAFGVDGQFKFIFGREHFSQPFGIACGADGAVYVTDSVTDKVYKFDATGTLLKSWGGRGAKMGQLWMPKGVEVDQATGRVFVIDFGNHRGQIFDAEGQWLVTFSAGRSYTRTLRPREEQ